MVSKLSILLILFITLSACPIDSRLCEKNADCFSDEICSETGCIQKQNPNNGVVNDTRPKDCEENADCSFGFCKKPEGICTCPIGEHLCNETCVSDIDPKFCGGCDECPTDPRGENKCTPTGECSITCEPPFQPCLGENCPRACVGCMDESNCESAAPNCVDNACTGCLSNDDCQRFSQKICEAGSCVQCTETSLNACSGKSCDPATLSCTETGLRSRNDCEPCLSDLECPLNYGCVKMNFAGADLDGGYCLEKFSGSPCMPPYPVRATKKSLSTNQMAEYCSISETVLTCKSLTDTGIKCEGPDDCGLENFDDGFCRPVLGIDRCSYGCLSNDDCYGGFRCIADYCLNTE